MLCWILLIAVILYFVVIDRELRAMRRDMQSLTEQLKSWGFIAPKKKE